MEGFRLKIFKFKKSEYKMDLKKDKSPKGSIDDLIKKTIDLINQQPNYKTT